MSTLQQSLFTNNQFYCPQFPPLYPIAHHDIDLSLNNLYKGDNFSLHVADRLSEIVRIPYVLAPYSINA